ncbi:phosphoethanolamine transferase [Pseudoxanthomonas mexicana]|uniref:Phosphoethanolamine transferase n=1 Tax=Pseudoxanthomonas mexicana TaxID=128785 RepID=A0A7G9T9U3_PSEMX|nr:phosphoethanolamine--lipid A transferase [Pseudoxanthomonas mexicana]QNN76868.1 phosphoethanolamine transferase [Pseudoxanthomonas mexicana]
MSAALKTLAPAAWGDHLRAVWAWRLRLSSEAMILWASVYFTLASNAMFWKAAVPSPIQIRWVFSLAVLITAVNGFLLALLLWPRLWRATLMVLIVLAAMAGHYMSAYGIYIDADMVRNVIKTDWREAHDLLGWDLLIPLVTAAPAILLVSRIELTRRPWARALLARVGLLVAMALLGALGAATSLQALSSFLRNQREVRYLVTPANVVVSLAKVISEEPPGKARVQLPIGEDAVQRPAAGTRKPRLLVLVVGETARAANWGLSGYTRQTTPALAKRNVVNYPHVSACGSSTEVSLPCMFSPYGRKDYNEKAIRGHQSVLHVLQRAGVRVLWRDNQSGCKGVCSGLEIQDLHARTDADVCEGNRCYDQILVKDLAQQARTHRGDQVIVLHMLGNHGPTYAERYPRQFARFTPECTTSDLGRCEREQIVNAYDNALLYTDHVLGNTIDALAQMSDYDTAMIYVSDHGESLGENGLFLHGMPYAIAPKEQLQVPMVAWFSHGWQQHTRLDLHCVRQNASAAYSHDNLFHTLLGLTDVRTALYQPDQDLYRSCRAPGS